MAWVILNVSEGQVALDADRVLRIQTYRGDTVVFYEEDDYRDEPLTEITVGHSVQEAAERLGLLP